MDPLEGAVWFLLAFAGGAPDDPGTRTAHRTATYGPFMSEEDCLERLREVSVMRPAAACRDARGMGIGVASDCWRRAERDTGWTCVSLARESPEAISLAQTVLRHEPYNALADQIDPRPPPGPFPPLSCRFPDGCFGLPGPVLVCRYPDRDPLYSDVARKHRALPGSEALCRELRRSVENVAARR